MGTAHPVDGDGVAGAAAVAAVNATSPFATIGEPTTRSIVIPAGHSMSYDQITLPVAGLAYPVMAVVVPIDSSAGFPGRSRKRHRVAGRYGFAARTASYLRFRVEGGEDRLAALVAVFIDADEHEPVVNRRRVTGAMLADEPAERLIPQVFAGDLVCVQA